MEKKKFSEISRMIKGIEKKNLELEDKLSEFSVLSRKNMLKEITQNIIKNSEIMKQMNVNQDLIMPHDEEEPLFIQAIVDSTITEIEKNPTKKVILLKELLNRMPDISVNDQNVIIQSLKDEEVEKLKEKILSLVKILDCAYGIWVISSHN